MKRFACSLYFQHTTKRTRTNITWYDQCPTNIFDECSKDSCDVQQYFGSCFVQRVDVILLCWNHRHRLMFKRKNEAPTCTHRNFLKHFARTKCNDVIEAYYSCLWTELIRWARLNTTKIVATRETTDWKSHKCNELETEKTLLGYRERQHQCDYQNVGDET